MVSYLQRWANRLIPILGLIATGWFVYSIGPWMRRAPVGLVIEQALLNVILASAGAAGIALCVYVTVSWTGQERVQSPLRSIAIAAWYIPAMILVAARFPMAIAAGGVLLFATTRLLVDRLEPGHPPLASLGSALFWKRLATAVACSLAIHLGVVALARGSTLLAVSLFAASLATMTSLAMIVGAYSPKKPTRLSHSVLGLLLILLMIAGVTIRKRGGSGYGGGEDNTGSGSIADDSFPGVILLRELEKNAVLIAPSLTQEHRLNGEGLPGVKRKATELTDPLDVTFSGEYWMFLPRYRRPPSNSLIERGNPSKLSFSTNGGPMLMEAHQRLNSPIDPASCDTIQIVVLGPGTRALVQFQLFLVDTETPYSWGEEYLGSEFVRGSADGRATFRFSIPATPRLKQFDEIKLVFRQPGPMNKSVKAEVERMTIMPR